MKKFKPVVEALEVRCLLSVSPVNPEALTVAEYASAQLVSSDELNVNLCETISLSVEQIRGEDSSLALPLVEEATVALLDMWNSFEIYDNDFEGRLEADENEQECSSCVDVVSQDLIENRNNDEDEIFSYEVVDLSDQLNPGDSMMSGGTGTSPWAHLDE